MQIQLTHPLHNAGLSIQLFVLKPRLHCKRFMMQNFWKKRCSEAITKIYANLGNINRSKNIFVIFSKVKYVTLVYRIYIEIKSPSRYREYDRPGVNLNTIFTVPSLYILYYKLPNIYSVIVLLTAKY